MERSDFPKHENTMKPQSETALSGRAMHRFSAIELLVVLVLWLVTAPVVYEMKYGDLIEAVLASMIMLSAVMAIAGRRETLVAAIILVVPAALFKWINHIRPDLMSPAFHATAAILFMAFVVVQLLRFILRASRVNTEVLCAGISGYILIGILWSLAYILVAQTIPESFVFNSGQGRTMKGIEAVYFSFVTLCTVGYGDIIPTSHAARMLAVLEATTGLFYVAVLIARLVAMHSGAKEPGPKG